MTNTKLEDCIEKIERLKKINNYNQKSLIKERIGTLLQKATDNQKESMNLFFACFDMSIHYIYCNVYGKKLFTEEYKNNLKEILKLRTNNNIDENIVNEIYNEFFISENIVHRYFGKDSDGNLGVFYKDVAIKIMSILKEKSFFENSNFIESIEKIFNSSKNKDFTTNSIQKAIALFNEYKEDNNCFYYFVDTKALYSPIFSKFLSDVSIKGIKVDLFKKKIKNFLSKRRTKVMIFILLFLVSILFLIFCYKEKNIIIELGTMGIIILCLFFRNYRIRDMIYDIYDLDDNYKIILKKSYLIDLIYIFFQQISLLSLITDFYIWGIICFIFNHFPYAWYYSNECKIILPVKNELIKNKKYLFSKLVENISDYITIFGIISIILFFLVIPKNTYKHRNGIIEILTSLITIIKISSIIFSKSYKFFINYRVLLIKYKKNYEYIEKSIFLIVTVISNFYLIFKIYLSYDSILGFLSNMFMLGVIAILMIMIFRIIYSFKGYPITNRTDDSKGF